MTLHPRLAVVLMTATVLGVVAAAQAPSPGAPDAARCRVDGRITSGAQPLPGVSLVVRVGDAVRASTSTDQDGRYTIIFAPQATYHVTAQLTAFATVERDIAFGPPPCDRAVDFELVLAPRGPSSAPAQPTPARSSAAAPNGRGTAPATPRFQALDVQPDTNAPAAAEAPQQDAELASLLPAGFSVQAAQSDAIAINGASDATTLDRGGLNARLRAINAGDLDPNAAVLAGALDGQPGAAQAGGRGGPGGAGRGGPPGGFGGRGGFVLAGRGARAQSPYQGSATYTFGGSALNAPPYQLRSDVPVSQPQYAQNTFGATFGGPFKIPGVYSNENRRTNVQINVTTSRTNNVFDQYATVPTDAMRAGDFSGTPLQLVDPATGQPFANNQIPANRIDPGVKSLLQFIPVANLPGNQQNFHVTSTALTSSQAVSLRFTQNLSPTVVQGGRGRAGGGGRGGFGGGFGGRGGAPAGRAGPNGTRPTNIILNGQLQYRRTDSQNLNVFPSLGGDTVNTSITAPIGLNVIHGRSIQSVNVNITHQTAETTNGFSNAENVAALAGIQYPASASTDPFNWGVPNLSITGLTGVRGAVAQSRTDDRVTARYAFNRNVNRHQLRIGGDYRLDRSDATVNANARGSYVFNGVYTSGGAPVLGSGSAPDAAFADFLLGLPAQATLQVGGATSLRQHSFDAYIEDNWQKSAKLTFNLGLRYDLLLPYVEIDGHMANLDAAPGFSAVSTVLPGAVGPYTGTFPAGLLNTDKHNVGPRVGVAYRATPKTIVRGGYSIVYNTGSYASIARELSSQPPSAETETVTGGADAPLTLAEALVSGPTATNGNWGVDRDYALGMIQTLNATVTRNLTQDWSVQAGYTVIKGTDLDILRAPTIGIGAPTLTTQPFIWESSGGRSLMNGLNLQLQRRLSHGISGAVSYTLAKSMDDASSLGAGGPVVAQNDNNLAAEYAPSTFDRRHQLSGTVYVELPWGPNRRWLKDGGLMAGLFGEWSAQFTLTLQSGTPLTARALGDLNDLFRGVDGSTRADYNGQPIQLSNPSVDEFFNVNAFSTPAGLFGTSSRDMIVGPGQKQLNGLFQRDLRIGGTRALTLQVNASNLLDTVQWAAVDTNVNSPTFGHVTSARPMRTLTMTARFRF